MEGSGDEPKAADREGGEGAGGGEGAIELGASGAGAEAEKSQRGGEGGDKKDAGGMAEAPLKAGKPEAGSLMERKGCDGGQMVGAGEDVDGAGEEAGNGGDG